MRPLCTLKRSLRPATLVWLVACAPWLSDEHVADRLDPDRDGFAYPEDCNSDRADAYPGATEVCDGIDNDCDGIADGPAAIDAIAWYVDVDGDGWGSGEPVRACEAPSVEHVSDGGDCDETRTSVHPEVAEVCNDGLDNDCDGGANTCVWSGEYSVESDAGLIGYGTGTDNYGTALVMAHADTDGTPDLLAGAGGLLTSGGFGVFYGSVQTTITLAEADARVALGALNPSDFGQSLANAGDLYGDGTDVIVIGAPASGSTNQGSFYLFQSTGRMSGDVYADFWRHSFGLAGEELGAAVSGLSDVDGDGDDELVVSAPGSSVGEGSGGVVRIFRGPASSISATGAAAQITGAASCRLGTSLSRGDLNGDGVEDVVIGSESCQPSGTATGAVHVVSGDTTGLVTATDASFASIEGLLDTERLGFRTAVGDANGDGQDDLWVAALGAPSPVSPTDRVGAAYLFLGPLTGVLKSDEADATVVGIQTFENFGYGIEVVPDLNGDGMDEFLIGAPDHAESSSRAIAPSGAAYMFYSPFVDETRDDADAIFLGVFGPLGFGRTMLAADLDSDGVSELIMGGPPVSFDDSGYVTIFWGVGL